MKHPKKKLSICSDCGVKPGMDHEKGCDVAICQYTGHQEISCLAENPRDHECSAGMWSGRWPGVDECEEYGLWCYATYVYGDDFWAPCGPDHPNAVHDLNRLKREYVWDRERQKWVPPTHGTHVASC